MKIKHVLANNRKKAFIIEANGRRSEIPFAQLKVKPSGKDPVVSVYIDREIGGQGFTYILKSGRTDTVLLEQVLAMNGDPETIRERLLYDLTCKAQKNLVQAKLSKRALARRLAIPPAQLYRLLDQSFYGKSIDQMIKLLGALGLDVKISIKEAARGL